jgi:hypothetical protein
VLDTRRYILCENVKPARRQRAEHMAAVQALASESVYGGTGQALRRRDGQLVTGKAEAATR